MVDKEHELLTNSLIGITGIQGTQDFETEHEHNGLNGLLAFRDYVEGLENALQLYLATYADTQTHPTASQEAKMINAARAALANLQVEPNAD